MTKAHTATDRGLEPHWKVRVVLPNAMLHLASWTEPEIEGFSTFELPSDRLEEINAKWIDDHEYGDTLGYIHWPSVTAITWRWNP